jgi:hypothetical protein
MKESNNIFLKLFAALALLPFAIIFYAFKSTGNSFKRMQANERMKVEARRGIVTVDASGKYNCLD